MTSPAGLNERGASPSSPTHRHDRGNPPTRQLQRALTELKKREEDGGSPREDFERSHRIATRDAIAATLQRLRDDQADLRQRDADARELQRDHTRSLVRLAQLETDDQRKVATHTAHVRLQHELRAISETMRSLEDGYQQQKKALAAIPDKNERHRQVQLAKDRRNEAVAPLRDQLRQLDSDGSLAAAIQARVAGDSLLPTLGRAGGERKVSSATYRQTMDQIRALQKTRKTMVDPYDANLKMAKLWHRINDHVRALENYEKAVRSLNDKQRRAIPQGDQARVLEGERRRKRDALKYLFNRSLASQERAQAAKQMEQYLELSTPRERLASVKYLEDTLRKQDYVENPLLLTPAEVTVSILSTQSLGPLTDLRFKLLQELLDVSPTDPYLLEAVASFHLRKREFGPAKAASDRFVRLPVVKQTKLFASLAEFRPSYL